MRERKRRLQSIALGRECRNRSIAVIDTTTINMRGQYRRRGRREREMLGLAVAAYALEFGRLFGERVLEFASERLVALFGVFQLVAQCELARRELAILCAVSGLHKPYHKADTVQSYGCHAQ